METGTKGGGYVKRGGYSPPPGHGAAWQKSTFSGFLPKWAIVLK